MDVHPLAGKSALPQVLIDSAQLASAYYDKKPDVSIAAQRVTFGTSGHRGTSLNKSFNEDHILAISQAICNYRKANKIDGPLFLGMDTHALSAQATQTAIEVFAANQVEVRYAVGSDFTPTPVISHAILTFNRKRNKGMADGVVVTPSHNPPEDGGFKYNPPHGGPAETEITRKIQDQANELLSQSLKAVKRVPYRKAISSVNVEGYDFITPYVIDLENILDMAAISAAGIKIGVDPLGGAGVGYWEPIAERYNLNISVVNKKVDPTFSFMRIDKDGKIRMDCSSPYAMAGLIQLKDKFDIAFGNDPDTDRHGIVTPSIGLLNPNHYLAVAVWYLFQHRPQWGTKKKVGKTLVSSSMIDRVTQSLDLELSEVPVGFKWFVEGLLSGSYGFGGEESAGATFLRRDGSVWTTDKDGIIMDLLAAEILAKTEKDPGKHYQILEEKFGSPVYERMDAPATAPQKEALKNMQPDQVKSEKLAGEKILVKLTNAPGNNAPVGGLKVVTKNGWFAARPSGTEDIYKIYAESFLGRDHLNSISEQAKSIVGQVFHDAGIG
ncbi:MAG: alpha-D-glucose phosphate-specific phosphoglucomutase [bacterium]|nr:MAG: alpha-D-glucose phosphate-specific phosphoglucomutase [bacterium]